MPASILVVDDDPLLLETLSDVLEDLGYVVGSAASGQAAIEQLRERPADVAILDFNLPDIKGPELAQQIQQLNPRTRVILMTGEGSPELGPAKSFVSVVLTKPVYPPKLAEAIKQIVE